jgi:hypothetical protein
MTNLNIQKFGQFALKNQTNLGFQNLVDLAQKNVSVIGVQKQAVKNLSSFFKSGAFVSDNGLDEPMAERNQSEKELPKRSYLQTTFCDSLDAEQRANIIATFSPFILGIPAGIVLGGIRGACIGGLRRGLRGAGLGMFFGAVAGVVGMGTILPIFFVRNKIIANGICEENRDLMYQF